MNILYVKFQSEKVAIFISICSLVMCTGKCSQKIMNFQCLNSFHCYLLFLKLLVGPRSCLLTSAVP